MKNEIEVTHKDVYPGEYLGVTRKDLMSFKIQEEFKNGIRVSCYFKKVLCGFLFFTWKEVNELTQPWIYEYDAPIGNYTRKY